MFDSVIKIGHTNRIESFNLVGGNWHENLPLENVKDKIYKKQAQSISEVETFDVVFDRARQFSTFAILNHNLRPGSSITLKVYEDFEKSTMISANTYQVHDDSIMFDDYQWEDQNFWFGVFTIDPYLKLNNNFIVFLSEVTATVIEVVVNNSAGVFRIGRLFIGETFTPKINMEFGAGIGSNSSTSVEESLSGVEYFNTVDSHRTLEFMLPSLDSQEASILLSLSRRGIAEEFLVSVGDYTNLIEYYNQTFPCRFESVNPLSCKFVNNFSQAFKLKEKI